VVSSKTIPAGEFQSVVLAVAHKDFRDINLNRYIEENAVVYDVKRILNPVFVDAFL
jgi:UDP-N-acetyl-D-galactosamine dehydrogenase